MIYLLLILLAAICAFVYWKLQRDIFAPSLLFAVAYAVSVGCAALNVKRWNIQMQPVTFWVLLLGAVLFVGLSLWVDLRCGKKALESPPPRGLEMIPVSRWKSVLADLGCFAYCALLYWTVMRIAGSYGSYSSFSQALNLFKEATSVTLTYSVPWTVSQLGRIVMICCYVFLYLFLNNFLADTGKPFFRRLAAHGHLLLPVAAYLLSGVLYSDRLQIMQVGIGGATMAFLLWSHRTGQGHIRLRYLGMVAAGGVAALLLFYFSASFIGRVTDKGLVEYITYYVGGSIECLNQFFISPPEASQIWGKETFYNLNLKLYNLGLLQLDSFYPAHLEFRFYGDVMLGNVYTAYRRWIYDFGFFGAGLLQAAMALIMSVFYNRLKYRKFRNQGFFMILYGYLAYAVVLHPYDGYLYNQHVSQTFLTTAALFFLAHWFFAGKGFETAAGKLWCLGKKLLTRWRS